MPELRMSWIDGQWTLRDEEGVDVVRLSVETQFEMQLRGEWCQVRLESGGYQGRYYITVAGERGRLAVGMQTRRCEEGEVVRLEQARRTWVGQVVASRVPLAGGLVRGTVREITERGQVVLVYTPPLNEVAVLVSFPLERIEEVLAVAGAAV